MIIQECEYLERLRFGGGIPQPKDALWFGSNQNKGQGIFSYNDYKLRLLDDYNSRITTIIPIEVNGGSTNSFFCHLGFNNEDLDYRYTGQVGKAIDYYESILKTYSVVLTGDFNSNVFGTN